MPMVRTQAGWVSAGVNVRHNGAWRGAREVWVKENGEWKNALTYKVRVWIKKTPSEHVEWSDTAPPGESNQPLSWGRSPIAGVFAPTPLGAMVPLVTPSWISWEHNPLSTYGAYCFPGGPWRFLTPHRKDLYRFPVANGLQFEFWRCLIPDQELAEITAYIQSCPGTHALFYFR